MPSSIAKLPILCGDTQSLHKLHRSIVTIYVGRKQYPFYIHNGLLCQHSSFFEGAFHGSFEEATTGSMYLEEDGVEEFIMFEEWLYSHQLRDPKDSADPTLLLVKVFCFADRVGISNLQNAALDAIRDRATRQHTSLTPSTISKMPPEPQNAFWNPPLVPFPTVNTSMTSPDREKSDTKYLPPATATAIHYAYQNAPDGSPLRTLLADIYAFNVKPEMLDEGPLVFPVQFMADVLVINMRRLPFRLKDENADFDISTERYYVQHTKADRKSGMLKSEIHEGPDYELTIDNESNPWSAFGAVKSLSGKAKKKKGKRNT